MTDVFILFPSLGPSPITFFTIGIGANNPQKYFSFLILLAPSLPTIFSLKYIRLLVFNEVSLFRIRFFLEPNNCRTVSILSGCSWILVESTVYYDCRFGNRVVLRPPRVEVKALPAVTQPSPSICTVINIIFLAAIFCICKFCKFWTLCT